MAGFFKWMLGLGTLLILGAGAGVGLALYGSVQGVSFTTPKLVPFDPNAVNAVIPDDQQAQLAHVDVPPAVLLPVPFTPQAPLNDWGAKQHTCEEASLVMVDRYLHGDHSGALIDPATADRAINTITPWKPVTDMTVRQLGELARVHLGWGYQILPASRDNIKQQLALGRPVIAGVRTHGLGNPNYPGYRYHYEENGWSVSHYLVVAGYDQSDTVILNDPGLTRGHGYHITFDQLFYAINDLDVHYPNLNEGQIILVLAPVATS